jgi:hypothetical protein
MKILITAIAVITICASGLKAQEKGTVAGFIADKNTQVLLEGIRVDVVGTGLTALSRSDGSFRIKDVPVGEYSVRFTSVNYREYIESNVVVSTGNEKELYIELLGVSTDEVVIEDMRFQKPIDVTTSYKSLSAEEIRRFPGGLEDIGRVIQSQPGVSLTSDGRNDLLVRGGSPAENLFIVDGFETVNINHFGSQGSTGGPISIINLDFVNKVNFLTGGFSAKYGDKLSSVVEIDQRMGNSDHFHGKVNLSGTGFGANFEGRLPFKNRSSWIVSARRSYLDFIFNAAGFGFVPEYTDFQFKGDVMINKNNFFSLNSFGALDRVRFNNETEENRQDNQRILTNNQNSYSVGFSWKSVFSGNSYAVFSLVRNYSDYFFSQRDTLFNEIFRNSSKEGEIQLKTEYIRKFAKNTFFSFGFAGKTIKLVYDINKKADTLLTIDPISGGNIILPPVVIQENNRTYKAFVYAELIQNLFGRVKITAGARYDYFALLNKKNYVSPRASIAVTITPKLSFNTACGVFRQSPAYIWLYGSEKNRNLEDIQAVHYITGLEYLFDESTRMTVEVYYKDYKYYPVSTQRQYLILANNSGFETQNSFGLEELVSEGTGSAKGMEILVQKSLTRNFYGQASISLSDAVYKALDGVKRRSDWDNRYVVNLNAGYRFGAMWEVSAKFRLAGGRPYTPINPEDGTIDYSIYNTETLPVYHRLDVRAEKKWMFKNWALTTYIDVQNITNRKNVYEYRWNQFTRQIEKSENLGILPTIGVSAEF